MTSEIIILLMSVRTQIYVMVAVTLVAYIIAQIMINRLTVQGKGSKFAGFFVGLGGRSAVLMAFSWAKFAFLVGILLRGKPVSEIHYLLYIALCLGMLIKPSLDNVFTTLLGGALLTVGMVVCTTLQEYMIKIKYDMGIEVAYWLLSALLICCAACILLRDVTMISHERRNFDESGEVE